MDAKRTRFSPSVVQAKALYAGLSALVKLANRRKNERTKFFCEAILRMWAQLGQQLKTVGPRTSEGVALLQNAEPNLRHLYLDIVWYSTEPYGNHEHKRVYSWRQGAIGPLNELINFAGAVLRELAVTRYPFPEPVFFQVREYRHDNVRILPHLEAERTPLDVVKKVYWRAGYKGSAKRPTYLLSHPTLPEMDFVDMIRAHVIELCRQCFIYNVPSADAHGYIRFLVHRLKPFLDWVYTGERTGRKDFWPDADKELRRLAREIRTLYGSNIGKRKRATEMLDEALLPQNACWLKTKATEVISATDDEEAKKQCARIAKMIDQAIIVDERRYETHGQDDDPYSERGKRLAQGPILGASPSTVGQVRSLLRRHDAGETRSYHSGGGASACDTTRWWSGRPRILRQEESLWGGHMDTCDGSGAQDENIHQFQFLFTGEQEQTGHAACSLLMEDNPQ